MGREAPVARMIDETQRKSALVHGRGDLVEWQPAELQGPDQSSSASITRAVAARSLRAEDAKFREADHIRLLGARRFCRPSRVVLDHRPLLSPGVAGGSTPRQPE